MINSMVGKTAPKFTEMSNYWAPITKTESITQIELKRPDGCAYAISINNVSNIVESWQFTSDRSLCEREIDAPNL